MEVEFDTRFQHPLSMIIAGSSGSRKTSFMSDNRICTFLSI